MKLAIHISLGVVLALVLWTGSAAAERVWTKTTTSLRAEPDDGSRRVARVNANRPLTVVRKKGRWLKVKRGAQSGWVQRAEVRGRRSGDRDDDAAAPGNEDAEPVVAEEEESEPVATADEESGAAGEDAPETAASDPQSEGAGTDKGAERPCPKNAVWCGKGRKGEAIYVVVNDNRVQAYKEPGTDQDLAFAATKDQELVVIGYHRPDWFYVQTLDGKFGWVPKTAVRQQGSLVEIESLPELDPSAMSGSEDGATIRKSGRTGSGLGESGQPSKLRLFADTRLGIALVGRSFTATNMNQANYETSSTGLATVLAGEVKYQVSGQWHAGLDGLYSVVTGLSGISYVPGGGDAVDVGGYLLHRFEASGKFGYEDGFGAFARAGFLVETFYINELLNDVRLPRERLISPTVGVELDVPDLVAGVGLGVRADVLLLGSLAQTGGLEDGDFDSLSLSLAGQLDAFYPLGERLALRGTYRYDQTGPSWTGTSARASGVAGASRTDRTQQVLLGVGMSF